MPRTVELDRLVNQAGPAPAIAAEQPQRQIVLRSRKPERPAQDHAPDRHPEPAVKDWPARPITRRISAARAGVARSSASIERTQSPDAASSAKLRWLAKSSNASDDHDVGHLLGDLAASRPGSPASTTTMRS